VEFSTDFTSLRKQPGNLAIAPFNSPPQIADLEGFAFENEDIKSIKDCIAQAERAAGVIPSRFPRLGGFAGLGGGSLSGFYLDLLRLSLFALGSVILSTPLLKSALTPFSSTVGGRVKDRVKRP
jgi:hypothetical protein